MNEWIEITETWNEVEPENSRKIWILLLDKVLFYLMLFRFQEGETVLISAARDGHLEVVRTLLSKYADVEAADVVSSLSTRWTILIQTLQLKFSFKSFAAFMSLWTIQIMPILLPVSSLWNKRKETELAFIYWNITFQPPGELKNIIVRFL